MRVIVAILACAALCQAARVNVKVTPVQKVIQLMEGMLEKGKKEKHNEQVTFAAYKQFCMDTEEEKRRAIEEANQKIESLSAAIQKYEADVESLTQKIAEDEEDLAVFDGDQKAATKVRDIERTDYDATHKDYSESIDALDRAIVVLKKQAFDRKQAKAEAALMQVKSKSLIPAHAKRVIDAFLSMGEDPLSVTAPEANAYEFQSSNVVDMLAKLKDKFEDERYTLEKEEANAKHAYELLSQDLSAQIATTTESMQAKKEEKAAKQQAAAEAKGDLADTTSTRDDDQTYLDDLVATCKTKSDDFESRQTLRAEEIEAIEKAIEIIQGEAVSGAATKHLPSLVQSVALVQLAADARSPTQRAVAAFLESRAERIHSHVLSALAVRASEDPFAKVKKLIQDLIVRLMEEANQEAEHKGWCDKELAANEATRKEKTEAVETLHAEIDQLDASVAKLTKEVAELTQQVSELDEAVAKATEVRTKEKSENEATIKDATAAQEAVASALTVLKDFYAKAGQATALVQEPADAPASWDTPYTGMQSENGGVVGMLEVIQSDFARLEADTKASEKAAQDAHDKFLSDSAVDKAQKNKDIEHKENKKTEDSNSLVLKKEDLTANEKELDAAMRYFDKLKPSCVNAGVSYEERVKRRQDEIESLQEALKILNGES